MSKRIKTIITTPESNALKELRIKRGLSLRKLGDRIGMSVMRVQQFESGRDDINDEYINKFLKACDFSWDDWCHILGRNNGKNAKDHEKYNRLRDKCYDILQSLEPSKLEKFYEHLICL